MERIEKQMEFILEIDKEKQIKNLCILLNDVKNSHNGYAGYGNYNTSNNGYYTEDEEAEYNNKKFLKRIFRKRRNG